jgi:hypothetical protein
MHGVGVCFTVNSYGLDTELLRGPDDPTCDLPSIREEGSNRFLARVIGDVPVGYKDLVEVRFAVGRALRVVD